MFKKDYVMRLIQEAVRAIVKLLFNVDTDKTEELVFNENERETTYDELLKLINDGKINEAENKLLDELDSEDMECYKMALMFYSYLNEKDIDFLEEHDYSKNEIIDGLKYVSDLYGYGSIAGALLNVL
ncbi:MAG: hypothetical protein KIC94_14470 [Clostridiales bacterium]|nr:hypothetical protein [Clostridiales bacterium]